MYGISHRYPLAQFKTKGSTTQRSWRAEYCPARKEQQNWNVAVKSDNETLRDDDESTVRARDSETAG